MTRGQLPVDNALSLILWSADSATKKLFDDLVLDEERHFGQFHNEAENVKRFGESYLAQQAVERGKAASAPSGSGA